MVKIEEHAFIRIGKDIKAGRIPGLVVLQGTEEYLVNFYADALVKNFVNEASRTLDVVDLDRETLTTNDVIESLETISILSDRKIVIIRDFVDSRGKYPKNIPAKGSEMDKLTAYIGNIPEGALLIITIAKQESDQTAKEIARSAFISTAGKSGNVYDFGPLDPAQLRAFIDKRFRGAGKVYRSAVLDMIIRDSGYGNKNIEYGLYELENDLHKIIAHCGENSEITEDDIRGVLTVNPENNIYGMIDAIGANRKDRALKLLHNLIEDGTNEYKILALLTSQLELMLITKEMKEDGMSSAAIQDELFKTERTLKFRTEKALKSANRFRTEDLKRMLSAAYDIDMQIKSGLYSGTLALEMLIAGV